jgi:hypothetical protein
MKMAELRTAHSSYTKTTVIGSLLRGFSTPFKKKRRGNGIID